MRFRNRSCDLDFVKLDNKYVYGGDEKKHHWYAVFKKNDDKDDDGVYLRQVKHLYQYVPERKAKLDKHLLEEFKSDLLWMPSGLDVTKHLVDFENRQFTKKDVDKKAIYKTKKRVIFK